MLSSTNAVVLSLLGLSLAACAAKDDNTTPDPGGTTEMPPVSRDVVDAGKVLLDDDADIRGLGGGGAGLAIPDAADKLDLAVSVLDTSAALGGVGSPCDVFATNTCADPNNSRRLGCYPKSDGTGSCKEAGFLPGGSRCDDSSPDSRCAPGYVCVDSLCTGLCHLNQEPTVTKKECSDSIGPTCKRLGDFTSEIGYCS